MHLFERAAIAFSRYKRNHSNDAFPHEPRILPKPQTAPVAAQAKIVEFIEKTYPAAREVEALGSPAAGAQSIAKLRQDVPVKVIGIVDGNQWLQVQLPDQRIAYVPVDAIPTAIGTAMPASATRDDAASAQVAAVPGSDANEPESTAPIPDTVGFDADSETLYVVEKAGVYVEPNSGSPEEYSVDRGTGVDVIAKTKDGKWAWVNTADGQPAFIAMSEFTSTAPAPDHLAGVAHVVDTATVTIEGYTVHLVGLDGMTGVYSKQLQSLIDVKGKKLDCHRTNEKYLCELPGGVDIGEAALMNGAARPGADASPEYLEKAAAARSTGRGVWAQK